MANKRITDLLDKYKTGTLTPGEKIILENWYLHQAANSKFEADPDEVYKNLELIGKRLPLKRSTAYIKSILHIIVAAASVLILAFFGGYFISHQKKLKAINTVAKNDIAPGKNQATLILANGTKVMLNDAGNGRLATQAGVAVSKNKKGELIYTAGALSGKSANTPQFNTLETARGEQYQVILPDGSHVWLNAASSLKYPVAFTGKARVVELTGEAYFEVAHNKMMPFKVKTQQQEVEVLGTHFNINAYNDEKTTATTLIEGSVRVTLTANQKSIVIRPGDQATVSHTVVGVMQVDTDDVIDWKNNYFRFEDEDLGSIMRKVSRWYNVEVEYQDNALRNQHLNGFISRNKNISQVVKILELTDAAHFLINGDEIIVTK